MPWHVENENPDCSGFAVVKDDDGEVVGCHETKDKALAHLAALNINAKEAPMSGEERTPPRENLLRASYPAVEFRAEDEDGPMLVGHFSRFNEWARIDSYEGLFMERVAPGAFARTLKNNRASIRVLLNHGKDPELGDKPIAAIRQLHEDGEGAYYEAKLLDGIPPLVMSGLRENQYGASFRFSVIQEDWDRSPKRTTHNPEGLPERTIREARVMEFGPVTWGAYAGATAGVRSIALSDLDAAVAPPEPALPGAGPEPMAHSDEGTRDTSNPAPPQETPVADITQYRDLEEMGARVRELNELIERDAQVPGILPPAAQAAFDAAVDERAQLDAAMTAWRQRIELVRKNATEPTKTEAPAFIIRKTETDIYDLEAGKRGGPQVLRDNAMRATELLRVTGDRYDQDKSRERLMDLIDSVDSEDKEIARRVIATNSPQYRAAFNRYVKSGGEERGTALAVGVDGTGGYAVPVSFDPTVVAIGAHTAVNPYRSSCRIVTISGTDTWQALTATAITAAYALEAAAATEQGPTFARPEFIAKRAHAFVTASYEMMQDRADLAAELGVLFGEARDNLEEAQFTTGVGTTVYPQGIGLKDAFTRVDSVTNDTVAVADVLAVEAGLPIRHRLNAAWYLTRKAIRAIQAWETTGGQLFNATVGYPAVGNPVARPGGNTGLTLLGYPVWETPSMPWTPTTDDTTWGVLMDPRNYVIVDRVGMSIRVIPDMLDGATPSMPTGEVGIYAFWRNTARVLNVDGGRQGAVQ